MSRLRLWISLVAQLGKESACNAGDQGSIPRSGKSPEGGNGMGKYPLQCSCLKKKKSMDRGAWRARVGHNWATKHACTCSKEQIIRIENKGVLWFIKTLLIGFIPQLLCTLVGGKYKRLYLFSSWKLWTYQNWKQWFLYKGYCSRKLVD